MYHRQHLILYHEHYNSHFPHVRRGNIHRTAMWSITDDIHVQATSTPRSKKTYGRGPTAAPRVSVNTWAWCRTTGLELAWIVQFVAMEMAPVWLCALFAAALISCSEVSINFMCTGICLVASTSHCCTSKLAERGGAGFVPERASRHISYPNFRHKRPTPPPRQLSQTLKAEVSYCSNATDVEVEHKTHHFYSPGIIIITI